MAFIIYAIAALCLIAVDQLSKYWAVGALEQGPIPVIPEVFELKFQKNPGIAFSMLEGERWLFIPLSLLMTALMIVLLFRSPMRKSKLFSGAIVLVIAGAIGNLIDRIILGYVIDFLYFKLIDFPVFNFADCCVVIGAGLLFVYFLFGMKDMENTPLRTLLFGIRKNTKESDHG